MTIWTPNLEARNGPKYLAIADALETDITNGLLNPGTRLPTHRDLSYRIGVTVGTVTRAYKEAEARGLLDGEIGRGTYVRSPKQKDVQENFLSYTPTQAEQEGAIDLGLNYPHPVDGSRDLAVRTSLNRLASLNDYGDLMTYQPEAGMPKHRRAGAQWLQDYGLANDPDRIVVTNGGQNAITILMMELTKAGDTVFVADSTYPGVILLAERLGVKLYGLEMDEQGIRPGALAAGLKAGIGRLLYVMPTLQNPTSRTMSAERRAEIAKIAAQYDALIIEDDVFGPLSANRPEALAAYAPDRTFYITSASKCMAAGLRIGFIHAPKAYVTRVAQSMRTSSWMAPPINAEIIADWIFSGEKDRFIADAHSNTEARQQVFKEELGAFDFEMEPGSNHAWLHLPHHWTSNAFVDAARNRGVIIIGAQSFHVGRGQMPAAIRISIARTVTLESLRNGCRILARLLDEVPATSPAVI